VKATSRGSAWPFSTIVHPKTGRLVDVIRVEKTSDTVTITSLAGDTIQLDATAAVHVLRESDTEFSWLRAVAVLGVLLGLVGLLIVVAFLGAR
jgi:hypothetical protein